MQCCSANPSTPDVHLY